LENFNYILPALLSLLENLLPLLLDCGTENQQLLNDPLYIGIRQRRPSTDELDTFVQEFVDAVQDVFPACCIHFEDWKGTDAIRLLARYKERICCYNDDIQGTAGVAVAGLIGRHAYYGRSTERSTGNDVWCGLSQHWNCRMIASAMTLEGLSAVAARRQISMFDVNGLLEQSRNDLLKIKNICTQIYTHQKFSGGHTCHQAYCIDRCDYGWQSI